MKIIVCFKVTPDLEKVLPEDWQPEVKQEDLSYAGRIINCFDESALEIALRFKEACPQPEEVECIALTMGEMPAKTIWQTLYAVGFSKVIVLEGKPLEFTPNIVAENLAATIEQENADMVLTGVQAPFGDTGEVPYRLAWRLGWPVVDHAQQVNWCPQGALIEHGTDTGLVEKTVKLPLVISVGNSPVSALRAATLRSKIEAGKKQVFAIPCINKNGQRGD